MNNRQQELLHQVILGHDATVSPKGAATYSRFSTVRQKSTSIQDQNRSHQSYAKQIGLNILKNHRYADEATSGQSIAPRAGLNTLVDTVTSDNPPFRHLIVESTSRLGRNMTETHQLVETLKSYGIVVHFIQQQLRTDSKDWKRFLGMYSLVDEWQLEGIRDATLRGMIGQIERGYSAGKTIYGFRAVPQYAQNERTRYGEAKRIGNILQAIPHEIDTVRQIFTWRVEKGWSCRKIAWELNQVESNE